MGTTLYRLEIFTRYKLGTKERRTGVFLITKLKVKRQARLVLGTPKMKSASSQREALFSPNEIVDFYHDRGREGEFSFFYSKPHIGKIVMLAML